MAPTTRAQSGKLLLTVGTADKEKTGEYKSQNTRAGTMNAGSKRKVIENDAAKREGIEKEIEKKVKKQMPKEEDKKILTKGRPRKAEVKDHVAGRTDKSIANRKRGRPSRDADSIRNGCVVHEPSHEIFARSREVIYKAQKEMGALSERKERRNSALKMNISETVSDIEIPASRSSKKHKVVNLETGGVPRGNNISTHCGSTKWGWCGTGCHYRHAICDGCGRMSPCEVNSRFPRNYVKPRTEKSKCETERKTIDGKVWCGWRLPSEMPSSAELPADDEASPHLNKTPVSSIGVGVRKGKRYKSGEVAHKKEIVNINRTTKEAIINRSDTNGCCSTSRKALGDVGSRFITEQLEKGPEMISKGK